MLKILRTALLFLPQCNKIELIVIIFQQNGKFNPVSIKERMIDPRPSHNCSTVEVTLIHVIDDDGKNIHYNYVLFNYLQGLGFSN